MRAPKMGAELMSPLLPCVLCFRKLAECPSFPGPRHPQPPPLHNVPVSQEPPVPQAAAVGRH